MSEPPKHPGFFKPIWLDRSSQSLEIPPSYVKHIKIKTSKNVNLKGPSGDTWEIELVRRDGRLYFEQGWPEFMKLHSLLDMDICVFEYDGKVDFKVKIFDGKSCIKRVSFDPESSQGLDGSVSEDAETSEHRAADSGSEDRLSFVEPMKRYNVSKSFVFRMPTWFIDEHYSSNAKKLEIVLENKEGKQWPVNLILKTYYISGGWGRFVRDNEIKEGDTCTFRFVHTLKLLVHISRQGDSSQPKQLKRQHSEEEAEESGDKKKKRVSSSDDDDDDIVMPACSGLTTRTRVADSDAEDFVSFTVTVKKYKSAIQNIVRFSSKFMSTHCSNYGKRKQIVLQNEEGKEWVATMCVQGGHRGLLSKGWSSFVQDNQIRVNDKCTFKPIDECKMLVLISRHCAPSQEKTGKVASKLEQVLEENRRLEQALEENRRLEQALEENRRLKQMVKDSSTRSSP